MGKCVVVFDGDVENIFFVDVASHLFQIFCFVRLLSPAENADLVYWDFQQIMMDHLFYDFLIAPRMCFLNSHYLIWFVFNVYLGSLFLSYSANWKFTKMTLSNFNFVRKFEYKIRIKIVHTHLSLHFFLFTLKKCCCSMPWLFFIFWFFTFNRYANAIPIPK